MAKGYKVRLGDGSEIGPMDLDTLRGWYVQGLITKQSPVMPPGSSRWTTLGETNEMRGFDRGVAAPGSPRGSAGPRPSAGPRTAPRPASQQPRPPVGPRRRVPVSIPARGTSLGLLAVLALAVLGVVAYSMLAPSAEELAVREWAAGERRAVDDATGVTIDAPAPWVVLKDGQTLVSVPVEARLVLANPKQAAFAYVVAERGGPPTPDAFLDQLLDARRKAVPGFVETGRTDRAVGKSSLRQAAGTWQRGGQRFQDLTLAGVENATAFALVGWEPDRGVPAQEVLRLAEGLSLVPPRATGLDEAMQAAAREAPQLTPAAAQLVMSQSAAHVLEPDETFRRSFQYMSAGLKGLSVAEQQEMGELTRAVYGFVPPRERGRLATYVARARAREPMSAQDTRQCREAMKAAVLKLPAPRRARLQALYEQAIRRGVAAP